MLSGVWKCGALLQNSDDQISLFFFIYSSVWGVLFDLSLLFYASLSAHYLSQDVSNCGETRALQAKPSKLKIKNWIEQSFPHRLRLTSNPSVHTMLFGGQFYSTLRYESAPVEIKHLAFTVSAISFCSVQHSMEYLFSLIDVFHKRALP